MIREAFSFFSEKLIGEVESRGVLKNVAAGTEILREGQYVKTIPIVLDGLVKVFTRSQDKELLLYYIQPKESCVMSFAAGLKNNPSEVFAKTEEDSNILLLPTSDVTRWVHEYPSINTLFYQQYELRYTELLGTINHVVFHKMDKRIFDYLEEKRRVTGKNPIQTSHKQIASELGTAREVVSRIIKKLETEGKLIQQSTGIELTN